MSIRNLTNFKKEEMTSIMKSSRRAWLHNYIGKEKYGDTPYIFVDDKDTAHAMPYTKVQYRVTAMIYDKDLRDDNGELFGFSTHIYRHYYGVKLTEMHLDDWTIAKLLGHSSVRNVKYYRKMSNQ